MQQDRARSWVSPVIRSYGTFERTTQYSAECDKKYGASDGYTFMGIVITCAS
jgi:hypothetical protein